MAQSTAKKRTPGERRRLRQFIICLLLFGMIFAGRSLDLAPVERITATVSRWVGADTDFRAVFAQMGTSFSKGEPAAETFHTLWSSLLPEEGEPDAAPSDPDAAEGEGTPEAASND